MEKNRIEFLDGLRGVAIFFVLLFHAYIRWPNIIPYGNRFASVLPFKYGFLGVQLFFLISGFVILMSLDKSRNFTSFIYKRWLRLFPAMAVATILIYLTSSFLHERPSGIPGKYSIIPGLFFIDPLWIELVTRYQIIPIEGSFWSLFVEVKFYLVFGMLYFMLGREKAIASLVFLFLISVALPFYPNFYIGKIAFLLSFDHFGWFAAGCYAYLYLVSRQIKLLAAFVIIAGIQLYHLTNDVYALFAGIVIIMTFLIPVYFTGIKRIFENRVFLFLGFISYPLYLIHENAIISLIVENKKYIPFNP
jgi:peptidoglycan/LPS O-acetylase OafA/YrhL